MSTAPALLYFGEVPVESSYHGSALLYRLLLDYPAEKLRIFERAGRTSMPERKLTGICYEAIPSSWSVGAQFLQRRLPILFWPVWKLLARIWAGRAYRRLDGFRPEAILTVHEGTLWLAAFFLARKLHVPLHLILHDDWFREYGEAWLRRRLQKEFGVIYRATASRFCVSPYMEEEFNRSFGARGDVLYPSRSPALDTSPDGATRLPAMRPFTVAYGGSTFDGGYGEGLRLMAKALALRGGKLLIFGPLSQADAQLIGLGGLNVQCCGLVSASELITRFRNEADALFVPMSFHEADRPNMSLSFPSKLADYTAAGLPLLISGPSYCSAVRWTKDNPGCAEIVEEQNLDSLGLALDRLMSDEDYRSRMGAEAGRVGSRYFSPDTARQLFMQRLVGA